MEAARLLAAGLGGMGAWSLTEYVVHRWLGHVFLRSRNPFGIEHRRHHATTSYFSVWWKKGIAAGGMLIAVAPIAAAFLGAGYGLAFGAGLVGTYVSYEIVHRRAHTHPPRGWYGRWVRRHHFAHHFHAPAKNHGVTSPLWDVVFGTLERTDVIRVPARHAMPWLVDEQTGAVRAAFAADYVLQSATDRGAPLRA